MHWRPCNYKNKLKVNIYNLSIYLQNWLLQVECLVHPDCWSEGHRFKSWQHVEHCHFIHMQLLRPFYKSTRHLRPNFKIKIVTKLRNTVHFVSVIARKVWRTDRRTQINIPRNFSSKTWGIIKNYNILAFSPQK